MLAADRRMGIVSIHVACGHATTRELAQEFGAARHIAEMVFPYPAHDADDVL